MSNEIFNISKKINDLDKPTINQTKGILNDFESETIILLSKTKEFSKEEIDGIQNDFENWMQETLKN